MPNLVNRLVVRELTQEFASAEGMVFVSYAGLNAKENEGLRNKLAAKGCKLSLVRNSLARLVLKEKGFEVAEGVLVGNTAIAYGNAEAALHAAKVLTSAEVKKVGKVKIRAGMLEGKLLDANDAAALADVPDRHTINGKLVSLLIASPRGIASILNQVTSGQVRVLKARADQLEKSAPASGAPEAAGA